MTRFCRKTCAACVARAGNMRRAWTAARSVSRSRPSRSGAARMFAGGHRVLDGDVDADSADRRHGVRGVADAQHAGLPPLLQPVDADGQQLEIVDGRELVQPVGDLGRQAGDRGPDLLDALATHPLGRALGDDEGALPVVAAVEHHQDAAGIEAAQHLVRVARLVADAEPQHVHRRADILHLEAELARGWSNGGRRRRPRGRRGSPRPCRRPWRARPRPCRPPRSRPRASACIRRSKPAKAWPWLARKSRKSHCGIMAMNGAGTGRWVRSAICTGVPPK